ncbi:MAG TPA: helix-hairpin-helix domain-containing protein [Candidatus Rubrimentiphilum sp.]|nr:helix-hairpin-helix domain-containing protein [Candidatus Rubrimentiphilum sp.]
MKAWAILAAGAILVGLAFLHPAPAPVAAIAPVRPAAAPATAHPHPAATLLVVYLAGELRRPGLYRVRSGSRANDAVLQAGGFLSQADAAAVNLAQPVQDGEEIRVPKLGECSSAAKKRAPRAKRARARAPDIPLASIDLNAADAADLARLPGLGETLAARIVAYRSQNGAFASVDELADVSGMTQRRIDAIAQYVIVK